MFPFVVTRSNPIHLILLFITNNPSNYTTHPLPLLLRFLHHRSPRQQQKLESITQTQSSSFTVSYLINSCGLSPQSALSLSKKIDIKSTENADSVLNVFKSFDFADTHIAKLVSNRPKLLAINPDTIIRPKLEFFVDIFGSGTQLVEFISSQSHLLTSSLEKRLKPNVDLLRTVFDTSEQLATAVRRNTRLLSCSLETRFLPNVRILQGYRVPSRNIAKLATLHPRVVMKPTEELKVIVESIRKMGFCPSSYLFLRGLGAMSGLKPPAWERKVSVYKSLGWSEKEFISAFNKSPFCMMLSEEKIRQGMDFFVNEMHWQPSFISERPTLLALSLEKRVIPRHLVLNVLASKGLVMRDSTTRHFLITEKDFLNKFVIKYQDQVPEVLQAYNGNVEFVGFEGGTSD